MHGLPFDFTPVPNGLAELVARYDGSGVVLQILNLIIRRTYGFEDPKNPVKRLLRCILNNKEIAAEVGCSESWVPVCLNKLEDDGLIRLYYRNVSRELAREIRAGQGLFPFSEAPREIEILWKEEWHRERVPRAEAAMARPRDRKTLVTLTERDTWYQASQEVFPGHKVAQVELDDLNTYSKLIAQYGPQQVRAAAIDFLRNPKVKHKTLGTFILPMWSGELLKRPTLFNDKLRFSKDQLERAEKALAEAQRLANAFPKSPTYAADLAHCQQSVATWQREVEKYARPPT